MGFKDENTNFINIELNANMKNLTVAEKNKKYDSVKVIVRERLRKSYENSGNQYRFRFYEEAFEIIQKYDLFSLLLNLVFDENKNIFVYLSRSTLKTIDTNNESLFVSNLIRSVKNRVYINNSFLKDFVENELTRLLALENSDWDSSNSTKKNEIVKKFARWLINVNKNEFNLEVSIYGYILFCNVWNNNKIYKENLSSKGSIFYNSLNKEIETLVEKGYYVDLTKLITEIEEVINMFFINKENLIFPFMIGAEVTSNGYLVQKKKFYDYVQQSVEWSKDFSALSYNELFGALNNSGDIISKKIKIVIANKLDKLEIPTNKELEIIHDLVFEGSNLSLKKYVFKRLYIY